MPLTVVSVLVFRIIVLLCIFVESYQESAQDVHPGERQPICKDAAPSGLIEHAAITMVILEQFASAEDVQQFTGITIIGYVMSLSIVGYLRDLVIVVAIVDSISYLSASGLDSFFEQSFRVYLINLGADCLGDSGDNLLVQCFLLLVCEHMRILV